jgi:hypothetical protein
VRELVVRLEYKRRICRKRVMAHFTDLDRRFLSLAGLVVLGSLLAPAGLPWMLVEVAVLVMIAIGLAFTIILAPLSLVLL